MSYATRFLNIVIVGLSIVLAACATPGQVAFGKQVEENVIKLDAKAVVFVDGKGALTLTDRKGNVIRPCGDKCKVFTVKGRVQQISSITILRTIHNPTCVYTYTIDGVTYEIQYAC